MVDRSHIIFLIKCHLLGRHIRKFRDVTYTIEVQNPNKSQKGISKLIVDGVTVDGNQIPYDASKKQVHVVAVLDA